jgi:hypothetical protein
LTPAIPHKTARGTGYAAAIEPALDAILLADYDHRFGKPVFTPAASYKSKMLPSMSY